MAYGNYVLDKGYDADNPITRFRAVKVGTSTEGVTPVTAAADQVLGFAQYGVTATEISNGKGASVRLDGITEAEASAAIARGAVCTIAADGRVKTAATGEREVGIALQAAAQAGDRIALRLNLPGRLAP